LYNVLQKKCMKGNLLNAIQSLYSCVKSCVKTFTGHSDFFNCPVGLRQGFKLSPILFVMFINELSIKLKDNNTRGVQIYPDTT